MKTLTLAMAGACALAATGESISQTYPDKPVRILVPFSAGSQTDVLARLVGAKLSEASGQPAVVDNRSSAGGILINATPDGHTLILHSNAFAVSAAVSRIVNVPELKERMRVQGVWLRSSTPEEFSKLVAADIATFEQGRQSRENQG